MVISSVLQRRLVLRKWMFGCCCLVLVAYIYLYRIVPSNLTADQLASLCGNSTNRVIPEATHKLLTMVRRQYTESKVLGTVKTDVFTDRASLVKNICLGSYDDPTWSKLSPTGDIWTFSPLDIHVCIVPKVGCTYWKQVLRFLSGDIPRNKNISKPSGVDRTFVHYGGIANLWLSKLAHPVTRMFVSSGNSFMFSRNPYTRLWSAYIDKAVLPDFWRTQMRPIMKLMRPDAAEDKINCPNDITFEEFLTYITKIYPNNLNEHWQPIYKICSPCQVKYKFIGNLETFGSDTKAILNDIGLGSLIENSTKASRDMEEIEMLSEYNFKLENTVPPGCLSKEEISRRLWTAFQYNGYIHRDIGLPLPDMLKDNFTSHPVEVFVKHVLRTVKYQSDQGIDIKHQKHDMMIEAYKRMPANVMEEIKHIYEYDFILFGYNMELS